MQKDAEKTVAIMRKKSGVAEALIYSIVPLLVLMYLFLRFWTHFVGDQIHVAHMIPVLSALITGPVILLGVLCLLGFNLLAYYLIFRTVSKVVACPWCCVAICLQVIAVGYCVVLFF
ncbi:MAG: hypothetical protein FVQ79_08535 [Planctomycetes bacterium]|nr:hypothetical protein [Planctomycetota bacterium]